MLSDAANITAKWSKDYGAIESLLDTHPTEAEDGYYYFDLTEAERNVSIIGEIFPESSTPGVQVIGVPASYQASQLTSAQISNVDLISDIYSRVSSPSISRVGAVGNAYNIEAFVGESHLISIPSADYTASEIKVVFQDINNDRDVAVVVDGSITKTSTTVAFAQPSKVRAKPQKLRYAVRRANNGEVLIYGLWDVKLAAKESS